MDQDYALGISIIVILGSGFLCCSSYFIYAVYVKRNEQETLIAEEKTANLV